MEKYLLVLTVLYFTGADLYAQVIQPALGDDEEALIKAELQRYERRFLRERDEPLSDQRIDATYYKLDLRVTYAPNYLSGNVLMKATATVGNLNDITLDLMNVLSIDSVKVDGTSCSYTRTISTFTIALPRPYSIGEMMTVETFYRGVPGSSGFGSFAFSTHGGIPWIWSLSEPYGSKDWWPCKDHPYDKADSVDVLITCDSTWKVGSNGVLISVVNNGDGTKTHFWKHRYPIASYLVSITMTNFAQFSNYFRYNPTDSMEILNYVLPEHLANAQASLPQTVTMLQIFSNLFGLYPFVNEKYGHAEFGWGGAMEHQTMTSTGTFSENVIAHELSHQWFGDMITCRTWPDLWLNEGFATYCTGLYREMRYGIASYWSYINGLVNSAKQAQGTLYVQDTTNVNNLFSSSRVYNKGAMVLHMLRHVLGDSVFFQAMYNYAHDPRVRFGTASTAEFRSVCETTSGRDLAWFFNEWVFGERYPSYTYSWSSQPGTGGYDVAVRINQTTGTPNPAFFTMPIDLKFLATGWDTTITIFNDTNGQVFSFTLSRNPTSMQFDPDGWILKNATLVAVDEPSSTPYGYVLEQNYPNPFNPSTTIKFEVPASVFVRLKVFDALGQEVSTLVNEIRPPGNYEVTFDADGLPSGMYFYQLAAGSFTESRKMIVLR